MSRLVLVLGAGASVPYGYPIGSTLLNDLTSDTFSGSIPEIYSAHNLVDKIKKIKADSIDQSLNYNTDLSTRFKPILALKMLQYEKKHLTNYNDIIFHADCVLMLGFAYHENNMKVLNYNFAPDRSNQFPEACFIYGTVYGIVGKTLERLTEKYQGIKFENVTVYEALKNNYEYVDKQHILLNKPKPPLFKPRDRYSNTHFNVVD